MNTKIENHPQGDVNLYVVTDKSPAMFQLPENAVPVPLEKMIVAYGEVTGHTHEATGDCQLLMRPEDKDRIISPEDAADLQRWLLVGEGGATITHEEHDARTYPEGLYMAPGRQREYTPAGAMFVGD